MTTYYKELCEDYKVKLSSPDWVLYHPLLRPAPIDSAKGEKQAPKKLVASEVLLTLIF